MTRLWFTSALLHGGWADGVRLYIADGVIVRVERGVEPGTGDDRRGPAIPGLPNLHSHTFQRAMAGLAERRGRNSQDDFWTWRETMYRFVDRLGPDDVEAVAGLAFAEMLETGFTRVGEFHYLHNDPAGRSYAAPAELAARIAAAAETTGIGLTLLPVFYAHSNFGGLPPNPGQRRFVTSLDGFARLLDDARRAVLRLPGAVVGVAPHSLRAVAPDELGEVVRLAAGGPIHIHVAEQTREVDDCIAWSGRRPVEWLMENQTVDNRWCLIHATHTTDAERAEIAARGAVAGLCPITEANLGDGTFGTQAFRAAGGRFGIGTDSNVLIDAAGELRQLEYAQRLAIRRRNVLASDAHASTGRTIYSAALAGGSQALGVSGGGLALGHPADIVALDGDQMALLNRRGDDLLDGWIFAARTGAIDAVWVRGRRVVEAGRHISRDALESRFRATVAGILLTPSPH